jgi:signal transduction histidine kinase
MRIFKHPTLYGRLFFWFLLAIIVPLVVFGYFNYKNYAVILEREVTDKLIIIANSKISEIEHYLSLVERNANAIATMPFVIRAMEIFPGYADARAAASEYNALDKSLRPYLTSYQELFEFKDLILISLNGDIVFTLSNEADCGINLISGPYKNSELAEIFKGTLQTPRTIISDFRLRKYPPSPEPSILIVTPVFGKNGMIGAVAFKIDTQEIYKLTSNYGGLGKTGEILLCLRTGNELTFANPLRHDAQAAFKKKVAMGSPIALPAQKSLQGINGFGESTDYRDKKVLAVWRYLPAPRWGMVVKIDSQEAYAPVFTVRNWSLLVGILVTGMGMLAALFVSKSISRPIQMLQRGVEMVGSGNLDYQVGISSEDEIGRLSRAFDAMTENLKNITASRDELNQIARELERSNQELQQFAYVASHDLQEPLRMVAGFTRLLERRYKDKLDQDAREFINFAVDGAVRMQKLIDDLLTYSRVGAPNIPFEPVDCNRLLNQAITNLRVASEESHAVITSSNLPTVTCNASQMIQLFQNLISNAIKFRGTETPRIHIAAEHRDSEWLFSFRDNGIGIDPQYKDRIFQIFQRLHSRDEYDGTGIGLALCMKIVELHKGKIWMESEVGKGATFYFTLPDREKTV